ncbi:MAG: DUF4355 domain-containing protein [Defluviitaleaceae bacterium]|nr:DUF4355 domain-containing protein [Defluviitaleaceae bacterium]
MKKHYPFFAPDEGGAGGGAAGTQANGAAAEGGQAASGTEAGAAVAGAEGGNTAAAAGDAAGAAAAGAESPAKYTEADFANLRAELDGKLAEETAKAVAKALERAKLPEKEQAELAYNDRLGQLEAREKDIAARELRADTAALLSQKQLPAEALELVMGADKDATGKNVDRFQALFDKAVQAQVEKRIAGKTPSTGNGGTSTTDPFIQGFNS